VISQEKIESLSKEIRVAKQKLERITIEDKASFVFLITGIILVCFGFIIISLVYYSRFSSYLLFLLGFLSTEFLLVGYSLMHKCLTGVWL
jgi:hypothetical protein